MQYGKIEIEFGYEFVEWRRFRLAWITYRRYLMHWIQDEMSAVVGVSLLYTLLCIAA